MSRILIGRVSICVLAGLGAANVASGLTFSDPSPSTSNLWAPVVDPNYPAAGLYVINIGNSYQWYTASTYLVTGFPHTEAANVFWGAGSRFTGGDVNPSVDGSIQSIDFSITTRKGSLDGVKVAMLLIQNGKYYRSDFFTQAPGPATPEEVYSGVALNAASFGEFVGQAYQYSPPADGTADFGSNPDFSAAGAQIQFGYLAHYQSDLTSGASGTAYQMTRAWSTTINFGTAITGWAFNKSGDWNDTANWVGGVPNAIDAVATLGNVLASNQTIYSNAEVRVGTLKFDSPHQYNLGGTGSLGIDVSAGAGSIQILRGDQKINLPLFIYDDTTADVSATGSLTIADPLVINAGTTLTKIGAGPLRIISTVEGAGSIAVSGGVLNLDYGMGVAAASTSAAVAGPALVVSGSQLRLGASQTTRGLDAQTANAGDQEIDLAGRTVRVYTADRSAAELQIYADIKSALLSASGKDGIFDSIDPGPNFAVGVTDAALDAHGDASVLVRLTRQGDANVDGFVDITDLGKLATAWQTNGLWDEGDFNYDGFIDITDLGLLATSWQQGSGAGVGFAEALAGLGLSDSNVPEPAALAWTSIGFLALQLRRRRSARMA